MGGARISGLRQLSWGWVGLGGPTRSCGGSQAPARAAGYLAPQSWHCVGASPAIHTMLHHCTLPVGPLPAQIITGERPHRGQLRLPRVPEECPQVCACSSHIWRAGSAALRPAGRMWNAVGMLVMPHPLAAAPMQTCTACALQTHLMSYARIPAAHPQPLAAPCRKFATSCCNA